MGAIGPGSPGRGIRLLTALGVALASAVAGQGTAAAATVTSDGQTLTYTAAPGERNALVIEEPLSITSFGFVYLVRDTGAQITVLPGRCIEATIPEKLSPGGQTHPIACVATEEIQVDLGDGDDKLQLLAGKVRTTGRGGEGNDDLMAGASAYDQDAHLYGGPGDDLLVAGDAANLLDGGPGNDELRGAGDTPGFDTLIGGSGNDRLYGDMDPPPNTHNSDHGEDVILGGPGDDILDGGVDADVLDGGSGWDRFIGDSDPEEWTHGDDEIFSEDGIGEPVDCGGGEDSVDADSLDAVEPDCESVT